MSTSKALTIILTILFCAAGAGFSVWLCVRSLRPASEAADRPRAAAVLRLLWAAFIGLFLFFILESGVCRRISLDLFLPVQDGQPMPWRMLRLGLCLNLVLAAADTEQVRTIREKCLALLRKDRGCWLISAAVTALFFLWSWRVTVFAFMTNDDATILRAIGDGSFWSLSSAFPHPYLCAALNWLYRLAPKADWYTWYHLAVLLGGMLILGRCLYLKLRSRSLPPEAWMLLHWLLGAGMILYTLSELSFTVTPAVAGSVAAALLLCRDETDSTASHVLTDLGSVVLMLLCLLQRGSTAEALICFWLLAAGYQLVHIAAARKPRRLRQAGGLVITLALTLALLTAVDHAPRPASADSNAEENTQQGDYSYSEAEHYRSLVMDYLLDKLTDEQLEAVGIPPELTTMLRDWYFMDERINTDTFRLIVETYPDALNEKAGSLTAEDDGQGDVSPLAAPFVWLKNMITAATGSMMSARRNLAEIMLLGLGILLALLLLRLFRYGLDGWLETLCGLCAAGGCGLMLLYLILKGRMLIRVFLVPAIPAAVVMLLMVADAPSKPASTKVQKRAASLSRLLVFCLGALCLFIARNVPYANETINRQKAFERQAATESYAAAHPEITFITNALFNDVDPFHDPWSYPANLSRWGDTGMTAAADRLYAEDFFRDDIQLMCEQYSTLVGLLPYLTLDYGPVQAQVVAQLSPLNFVASLSQVTPGEDYTGWYEHNGMTYYFRDGQALTGEQVIDSKTYTFAPIGAKSQFCAVPGREGSIYSTNAYSLITPEADTP